MLHAMILRPSPSPRHNAHPPGNERVTRVAPVPSWLRRAVEEAQTPEDAALAAGVAIGALDAVVRRQERWAGVWRQRLALSAAAATARQAGRADDEAALRDAVLLTRPGDDVGPAGRMLRAWRKLAARPAEKLLTEGSLTELLNDLGLARDDEALSDLAAGLRQLAATEGLVRVLTGAVVATERHGVGRIAGCWLADVLLAHQLGWAHAVPLLGTEPAWGAIAARRGRLATVVAATGGEAESDRAKNLLAAQARAAVRAAAYPPKGERGVGPGRAAGYGYRIPDYLAVANARTVVAVQVETAEGLANIPEIVAVEGVEDACDALEAGVRACRFQTVALLSGAAQIRMPGWLGRLERAYRARGGQCVASPTLLFEDDSIRWAGAWLEGEGASRRIANRFVGYPLDAVGNLGPMEVAAGASECCVLSRAAFIEVGGFARNYFTTAEKGFDLCLKLRMAGSPSLWVPDVEVYAVDDAETATPHAGALAQLADRTSFDRRWALAISNMKG